MKDNATLEPPFGLRPRHTAGVYPRDSWIIRQHIGFCGDVWHRTVPDPQANGKHSSFRTSVQHGVVCFRKQGHIGYHRNGMAEWR